MPITNAVSDELVNALPAGDNLIGRVKLSDGTDVLIWVSGVVADSALKALPVAEVQRKTLKRAVLNSATDNAAIVAAVAGKVIKVVGYAIQATGTVNVELRDGSGGTAMTMLWNLQAREGAVSQVAEPPYYLFKTTAATSLNLGLSAAVTAGVEVTYFDDDAS